MGTQCLLLYKITFYPSPPWYFTNGHTLCVTYEAEPESIAELLPDPLEPDLERLNMVTLSVHFFPFSVLGPYHEATVRIPVKYKDNVGSYIPYMWEDSLLPIACGREIWGHPKKYAEILLTYGGHAFGTSTSADPQGFTGGIMSGVVSNSGINLFKIHVNLIEKVYVKKVASQEVGWDPDVNLKIIPSVDGTKPLRQLVILPYQGIKIKEMWKGPATVSFEASPTDSVWKLAPVKVVSGSYSVVNFSVGFGKVLHNY